MVHRRIRARVGAAAVVLAGAALPEARADRIILRGGGELKGVVLPDAEPSEKVRVQTEKGASPIAFDRAQIVKVVRVPGPLDEYFERRDRLQSTAESEYALGLWCEERGLAGLADVHYRRAVEHDKAFEPAHRKLGHVLHDGRWMTVDQMREAQGLVKLRGKWVTPQEKARFDAGAALTAEQASWRRRIKVYRQALQSERPESRRRAERDLLGIREPAAVSPLVAALGQDAEPVRLLLVQALGAIPGDEALRALVGRILAEPEPDVRLAALEELTRREDAPGAAPELHKALKQSDPAIVGRAAWALAGLNETAAVPKLVGVLVSVQQQVVMVPSEPSSAGAPGLGFASVGPTFVSGGGPSIPVITGASVGPGVVAYGATSVPLFSGAALGGGGAPQARPPQPRVVRYLHQNDAVREALVKLTGVDFGFDVPSWRRWLVSSFRAEPVPTRRVPQP